MVHQLMRRVAATAADWISRAQLIEGVLEKGTAPARCLLVDRSHLCRYFAARAFSEPPIVVQRRPIWIPSLPQLLERHSQRFDLCIAKLPAAYGQTLQGLYDFRGPSIVRQAVDLGGSWDDVLQRLHGQKRREARRVVDKSAFTYRLSNEPADLERFYEQMYVPHVRMRFGGYAALDSLDDQREVLAKGFLLFVLDGGRPIAGALCMVEDGVWTDHRSAVLDGDRKYSTAGAQVALMAFQLRLAHERGLRQLNLIQSMPFLRDGVYCHKREWGAGLVWPDTATLPSRLFFFIPRPSDAAVRFFAKNPMFIETPTGLAGLVGVAQAALTDASRQVLIKQHAAPGLEGLHVLVSDSKAPVVLKFQPSPPASSAAA